MNVEYHNPNNPTEKVYGKKADWVFEAAETRRKFFEEQSIEELGGKIKELRKQLESAILKEDKREIDRLKDEIAEYLMWMRRKREGGSNPNNPVELLEQAKPLVEETLVKATAFVNNKLETQIKPLVTEMISDAKYVAIRVPGKEEIYVSPEFFPKDKAGQKTILIHEVSEIAYEKMGVEQPHTEAVKFTQENWKEIGGKDPEAIHKELITKGYYYGKSSLELDIRRMIRGELYESSSNPNNPIEMHNPGNPVKKITGLRVTDEKGIGLFLLDIPPEVSAETETPLLPFVMRKLPPCDWYFTLEGHRAFRPWIMNIERWLKTKKKRLIHTWRDFLVDDLVYYDGAQFCVKKGARILAETVYGKHSNPGNPIGKKIEREMGAIPIRTDRRELIPYLEYRCNKKRCVIVPRTHDVGLFCGRDTNGVRTYVSETYPNIEEAETDIIQWCKGEELFETKPRPRMPRLPEVELPEAIPAV